MRGRSFLVCVGFCILFGLVLCPLLAQQSKKVEGLKKNLSSVKKKKKELQSAIQKTKRAVKVVMADIERVDGQLSSLEGQIEKTQNRLGQARVEQKHLREELDVASAQLYERKQQVRRRVRQIYMQGEGNMISVWSGSEGVGDFATRTSIMERIAQRDKQLFQEVVVLRTRIAQRKHRQDGLVIEIATLEKQQKGEQVSLKGARKAKQGYLGELKNQQAELRKQYDELEAESQALESQIRALQVERQKKPGAKLSFRGGFIQPVAGKLTSGFGMRFHPILKESRMHTGADFGARHGTPIVAAADGEVLFSGYKRGYGNTVILDHGGGVATLYGHCSQLHVSQGQQVKQGQKIAAVGSTGLSTGPHLHFEVRIDGKPVNPLSRL